MTTLKKLILTCLVSSQPFTSVAQYFTHFNKDGKLEKVTQTATVGDPKAYPSLLSNEELHFDITGIDIPESSFWEQLKNTSAKLLPGPFSSNPANDILNGVRAAILPDLTALVVSPTGALKYDPTITKQKLPLQIANAGDVYKVETTEYDHDLNVALARPTINLGGRDRIEYKLIRNQLDNDILKQHLKATKGDYKGWPIAYEELLLDLRQKFRNQGWEIDAILVRDSLQHTTGPMHQFNVGILKNLDSLTRPIDLTDMFYRKVLTDNKPWIEAWLWYTGGEVKLNPFQYADPAKLIERADREIKELESELNAMANQEVSLDESGRKDRLAFLLARLQTLKQAREDLGKANDEYSKWLANLSVKSEVVYSGVWHGSDADEIRWLHQFDAARDFRLMNTPKSLPNMVAEQDQVVIYTHNLGTDDKITISSIPTPFQPKSGLETTTDAIAVELAKAVGGSSSIQGLAQLVAGLNSSGIKDIKPMPSLTDFKQSVSMMTGLGNWTQNDSFSEVTLIDLRDYVRKEVKFSPFSYDKIKSDPSILQNINSSIKTALDNAKSNLATAKAAKNSQAEDAATNDIRLAEALIESVNSLQTITKANALIVMYIVFEITDQTAYNELIQSYSDSKKNLIWLSAQTVPILSINLKPDEKPIYHTYAEFPEKKVAIESSNKVAYTITLNDKTTVARQTYSKYFTTRFMPSFGLVYVFEDRSSLTFDETTGQFKPQEKDFDHIEALVGVKWYPWKTHPARTWRTAKLINKPFNWKANLSRGSNFLNTLYISGGMGVRRQLLRNYYLGAGFDLFPGLSIQGGGNFIFQKQYELENSKIKSETEVIKSCWYLGLGLDLGLVTNLIKLLIP